MTDTYTFKTIAIKRSTNEWKTFYGIHSIIHRAKALAWLRS